MTAPARARRTSRQISAKVPGSTHPSTSPQVARSPSPSLVLPASTPSSRASSSGDDPHFWPDKPAPTYLLGECFRGGSSELCEKTLKRKHKEYLDGIGRGRVLLGRRILAKNRERITLWLDGE